MGSLDHCHKALDTVVLVQIKNASHYLCFSVIMIKITVEMFDLFMREEKQPPPSKESLTVPMVSLDI